jgi:NADH dehydrogenase/NADH:ubiquinone oxidoreductase subunit G
VLGKTLPYDGAKGVRARLAAVAPHFALVNNVQGSIWMNGEYIKAMGADKAGATAVPSTGPLASPISNFFMTDAISRASQTMAKCVQARAERS